MTSIGQAADEVISAKVKNVADLQKVDINEEIYKEKKQNSKGQDYVIYFIKRNEESYRIPYTVLETLKGLRKQMTVNSFRVLKTGTTKDDTKYTVTIL